MEPFDCSTHGSFAPNKFYFVSTRQSLHEHEDIEEATSKRNQDRANGEAMETQGASKRRRLNDHAITGSTDEPRGNTRGQPCLSRSVRVVPLMCMSLWRQLHLCAWGY